MPPKRLCFQTPPFYMHVASFSPIPIPQSLVTLSSQGLGSRLTAHFQVPPPAQALSSPLSLVKSKFFKHNIDLYAQALPAANSTTHAPSDVLAMRPQFTPLAKS